MRRTAYGSVSAALAQLVETPNRTAPHPRFVSSAQPHTEKPESHCKGHRYCGGQGVWNPVAAHILGHNSYCSDLPRRTWATVQDQTSRSSNSKRTASSGSIEVKS